MKMIHNFCSKCYPYNVNKLNNGLLSLEVCDQWKEYVFSCVKCCPLLLFNQTFRRNKLFSKIAGVLPQTSSWNFHRATSTFDSWILEVPDVFICNCRSRGCWNNRKDVCVEKSRKLTISRYMEKYLCNFVLF